jgi:ABC-2 type transport system permease protein
MVLLGLKEQLAYAKTIIFREFLIGIIMIIFINLWSLVYQNQSEINGITFAQVIFYLLITESYFMARTPVSYKISEEIKSGSIAYSLARPFNLEVYYFLVSVGDFIFKFITNLLFGMLILLLFRINISITFAGASLFLITIIFGYGIDYCFQFLIGVISFVEEEISGYVFIYEKLLFIFGGILFPVALLEKNLQQLFCFSPFLYIIGFPTQTIIHEGNNFGNMFVNQIIILVCLILISTYVFNKFKKKIVVNGG